MANTKSYSLKHISTKVRILLPKKNRKNKKESYGYDLKYDLKK